MLVEREPRHGSKDGAVKVLGPDGVERTFDRILRFTASLAGECHPALSPLTQEGSDNIHTYRYDWTFGISGHALGYWNWQEALTGEHPVFVQIVIRCNDPAISFFDISASLLTMHPSKDTRSWLEQN